MLPDTRRNETPKLDTEERQDEFRPLAPTPLRCEPPLRAAIQFKLLVCAEGQYKLLVGAWHMAQFRLWDPVLSGTQPHSSKTQLTERDEDRSWVGDVLGSQ